MQGTQSNSGIEQPAFDSQSGATNAQWPDALPADVLQPWERLDSDGHAIPAGGSRGASALNQDSELVPGVERFLEGGAAADNGEATHLNSTAGSLSYAMYRIPLGGAEPGVVSVDANTTAGNGYFVGLANYSGGAWEWHGPFVDNHIRLSTAGSPSADYTSPLGNVFVCVAAYDAAACDVVGIGLNAVDAGDTIAPPTPAAPSVTPVSGGLFLEWLPVVSGDLAGYRLYYSSQWFLDRHGVGVKTADGLEGLTCHVLGGLDAVTYLRISSVDISGNESPLSDVVSAEPLAAAPLSLHVVVTAPSGGLGEPIIITATGANNYDFDVDGDGIYEITGDTGGNASIDTDSLGVIRACVRGSSGSGTSVALGGASVIISGNSRPVACASATPTSGDVPLDVTFTGTDSTDFDGSIVGGGWDFDGDGTYDAWSDTDTAQVSYATQTYDTPGMYNAKLRVVDDKGAWDVDTVAILVGAPASTNNAPVANLQGEPTSGDAPLTVSFDASGSNAGGDPGDSIVEYAWDWDGDGQYDALTDTPLTSHTFTAAGSPEVRLRVEDSQGARATDNLIVAVNVQGNEAPQASLEVDQDRPRTGQMVTFDASGSSDAEGGIVLFEWDFDGDGAWDSSGTSATASHSYGAQCGYMVRVRVTDEAGAQDTASLQLAATHGSWTMRGHDTLGSGRSPYVGPQTNSQKWVFSTNNPVISSPAVAADGTVYVGSFDHRFFAINPSGLQKWAFTSGGNVYSSPAIAADGTVYFGCEDNKVYALNPDGTQKWVFTTSGWVDSSPAIGADGTVYVGSYDNMLYAINPDGTQKWAFPTGNDVFSSPAIGADGTVYVGSFDNMLHAVNPDGTQKWSFVTSGIVVSSPAVGADGTVYVGSNDNNLYAINPDGTQKWAFTTGNWIESSPAIGADGTIYVGSYDNNLYAINPDGTQKWTFPTISDVYSSPAIGADGTVYVGSYDHQLYAVNPDGTQKWVFTTGNWVTSSPAIGADGRVYVGSVDWKLYAIGT